MSTTQASAINTHSFLSVWVATMEVMRSLSSLFYEACGMASPIRVRLHSTRNVASSRALARGALWQDFYGPHIFIRFYSLRSFRVNPVIASTHKCLCRNTALWTGSVQWCGILIASSHHPALGSTQKGTSQVTGLFRITFLCSS